MPTPYIKHIVVPRDRIALLDHARAINNEHDAAVYLRQAAERIRHTRQRVEAIGRFHGIVSPVSPPNRRRCRAREEPP